jgi:hypothetical protein
MVEIQNFPTTSNESLGLIPAILTDFFYGLQQSLQVNGRIVQDILFIVRLLSAADTAQTCHGR